MRPVAPVTPPARSLACLLLALACAVSGTCGRAEPPASSRAAGQAAAATTETAVTPVESVAVAQAAPVVADTNATTAKSPVPSADWPSFRNGNAQCGVATSTLPDQLSLLWTHKAGEAVTSTAAIVGQHVYCASLNGEVFCLELATGKRVWTYRSRETSDPKTFIPGFKASPTVTERVLFIGDEEGLFHAIDRETGKQKWTFTTGGEIVSSASLLGDRVVFGSHDNSLYCLQAADGAKLWQFVTDGMVNCSPAISGTSTFITGCDEHLRVIDVLTGKQQTDMPLGTYLIASPAVLGDMLYVGTYASEVVGIDWKGAKQVWAYKDADREFPYHSSAAVNDDYVVVGGQDKKLHCIDRKSGAKVWAFPTKAKIVSSPVIAGNRVFCGSNDGNVYGVDLKTGKELWRHTDGRPFSASPAIGGGRLVIGSESNDGTIYCFGRKN